MIVLFFICTSDGDDIVFNECLLFLCGEASDFTAEGIINVRAYISDVYDQLSKNCQEAVSVTLTFQRLKMRPKVAAKLGYYVYANVDPRDSAIFYVGKGRGGRAVDHLDEAGISQNLLYTSRLSFRFQSNLQLGNISELVPAVITSDDGHVACSTTDSGKADEISTKMFGYGSKFVICVEE